MLLDNWKLVASEKTGYLVVHNVHVYYCLQNLVCVCVHVCVCVSYKQHSIDTTIIFWIVCNLSVLPCTRNQILGMKRARQS